MIDKAIRNKISKYNKLQKEISSLGIEIDNYLDDNYHISDDYVQIGSWVNPYCVDGVCPIKPLGNEGYDIEKIDEIITFIEHYRERIGEDPDINEVMAHFEEKEQEYEGR